ncbi:hypothetical protein L227DRAFT_18796 [Lentinus tigrinus ALCF2SS1-6]|uniref:Uncharacterized protein n=1 Tax=Lentinus tigrinus ALCF2SS1-6 TaxID=1328759 RepID=A0A5C2SUE3_9APHY|nr:hypothetical protein L227DRAFT_18796 [Lentinus tigrinus ALCF2SS1-6]
MIEEDEENEEDEEDEDEDEETAPPTQDDQGPMPVTESAQKTPPHVPVEVENAKHAVEEGPLSTVPRKRSSSLGGVDKKGPDEKRLRQETSNIQAARAVVSEPPLEVSSGPVEDSAPVSQKAVTAAPLEAGMARKEKEC